MLYPAVAMVEGNKKGLIYAEITHERGIMTEIRGDRRIGISTNSTLGNMRQWS